VELLDVVCSCARLYDAAGSELEQIQFLLEKPKQPQHNLILAALDILSGVFDFSTAGRPPQPLCKNQRWNPAEVVESG